MKTDFPDNDGSHEQFPEILPTGSYWARQSVPFDFAEVEASMHGSGPKERNPGEFESALVNWLSYGIPTVYPRRYPHRMGLRCIALLWILHPDRMPWSAGKPQSARQVADALGVSRQEFYRITGEISKRLGFVNGYQDHAWQRKSDVRP